MNKDLLVCQICKKELKHFGTHLKYIHGMTVKQYSEIYPNEKTISDAVRERMSSSWTEERKNNCLDYLEQMKKDGKGIFSEESRMAAQKTRVINGNTFQKGEFNIAKQPEIRAKISKGLAGKPRIYTPESREQANQKLSVSLTLAYKEGRKLPVQLAGEDHPNYRGGTSGSYGKNWYRNRRLRRERDNKTCQLCGKTPAIEVHHIIPFKVSHDNGIENLITLCHSCHSAMNSYCYKVIENKIPLSETMRRAGVEYKLPDDIVRTLWRHKELGRNDQAA